MKNNNVHLKIEGYEEIDYQEWRSTPINIETLHIIRHFEDNVYNKLLIKRVSYFKRINE